MFFTATFRGLRATTAEDTLPGLSLLGVFRGDTGRLRRCLAAEDGRIFDDEDEEVCFQFVPTF